MGREMENRWKGVKQKGIKKWWLWKMEKSRVEKDLWKRLEWSERHATFSIYPLKKEKAQNPRWVNWNFAEVGEIFNQSWNNIMLYSFIQSWVQSQIREKQIEFVLQNLRNRGFLSIAASGYFSNFVVLGLPILIDELGFLFSFLFFVLYSLFPSHLGREFYCVGWWVRYLERGVGV